ncbi:MAG: hypothetical protein GYB68_06940 [Chloroflexi bacterium]|nr:hypothetical protein [Chloroflexota bacterium]
MADETTEVQAEPSDFIKHLQNAGQATAKQWGSLIPAEFWQHGREARRETLMAFRSLLDAAIDGLEKVGDSSTETKTTTKRKAKIAVD